MYYSLGLWVYRHRWHVIIAWVIAVAVSLPLAPKVGTVLEAGGFSNPESEGAQAIRLLREKLGLTLSTVTVLLSSPDLTVEDPSYQREVDSIASALGSHPHVAQVLTFRNTGNRRLVSQDKHATYMVAGLDLHTAEVQRMIPEIRELVHSKVVSTWVTGAPAGYADIEIVSHRDLQRAEQFSFPLALVALVLVFGTVVAGLTPVVVGGASVVVALALIFLLGHFMEMSIFVMNVTTMLGLGIGIDYSLIMVSRFREELGRGSLEESVAATVATAGKAVFFSGVTVFLGLTGLLVFQFLMLRSMGVGGCIVVAVSVLAALTLLPAVLGVVGHRVDALRVRPSVAGGLQLWPSVVRWVTTRPWPVFAVTLLFLALLGAPFLRVRMGAPDITILPTDVPSRQGYDILTQTFGIGQVAPILVVLETQGSIFSRENVGAVYDLVRSIEKKEGVERVDSMVSFDPNITKGQYQLLYQDPEAISFPDLQKGLRLMAGSNVTVISVVTRYTPVSEEAKALVRELRGMDPYQGMTVYVGGAAAELMDIVRELYSTFPKALLLIVVTTYIALLVFFGSVVIPLKAIIMDVLSILASYGALVMLFQEGHLSSLLRFTPAGYVDATVPIVMFCILFGLSMDYEVFMLSRIKEEYDSTGENTRSVAVGLERTGRIVTSAAMIILLVSGSFALADIIIIKALGIGIALAIFLDATVVRALLVPATMQLLGDINWWAPRPLKRALSFRAVRPALTPTLSQWEREPERSDGG